MAVQRLWNPVKTLDLDDVEDHGMTCYGYAPSKGRRCRIHVAYHNQDQAKQLLDSLASKHPLSQDVQQTLLKVAGLILCKRFHQDQAPGIVATFNSRIQSNLLVQKPPSVRPSHVPTSIPSYQIPLTPPPYANVLQPISISAVNAANTKLTRVPQPVTLEPWELGHSSKPFQVYTDPQTLVNTQTQAQNILQLEELKQLRTENSRLKDTVDSAVTTAREVEAECDALRKENHKLRELFDQSLSLCKRRKERNVVLCTENAALESKVAALEAQQALHESEQDTMQKEIDQLLRERALKSKKISALKKQVRMQQREQDNLEQRQARAPLAATVDVGCSTLSPILAASSSSTTDSPVSRDVYAEEKVLRTETTEEAAKILACFQEVMRLQGHIKFIGPETLFHAVSGGGVEDSSGIIALPPASEVLASTLLDLDSSQVMNGASDIFWPGLIGFCALGISISRR
ncbi:hypothetical protein FH972_022197 [Carpinus fangiana]|uniref:Uncharacterized protein n=1 Tax=Carpinus fangiana TaxID=176857 RepID=A0A5N6KS62_9ROSI|nr:hypothetical protein FH972_022197 [Carpinus fangiana]